MGHVLDKPLTSKHIQRWGNAACRVGAASMQGYRNKMEDRHVVCLGLPQHPQVMLFAIFDGHGGEQAADYMANNIVAELDKIPDLMTNLSAVEQSFCDLDSRFLKDNPQPHHGTTACVVLLESQSEGYLGLSANLGDSRFAILSPQKIVWQTKDHKPSDFEERGRISEAGGYVQNGRVDGNLALSRAIGDSEYKNTPDKCPNRQKVIPLPTCHLFQITDKTLRLLIMCDGLLECMSMECIHSFLNKLPEQNLMYTDGGYDPAQVAVRLLTQSLERGSKDNMSLIYVDLNPGLNYGPTDVYFPATYDSYEPIHLPYYFEAYLKDAQRHGLANIAEVDQVLTPESRSQRSKDHCLPDLGPTPAIQSTELQSPTSSSPKTETTSSDSLIIHDGPEWYNI